MNTKQAEATRGRSLEQYDLVLHGWLSQAPKDTEAYLLDITYSSRADTVLSPLYAIRIQADALQDKTFVADLGERVIESLRESQLVSQ